MFRLVASRRAAVELLLFAGLIAAGVAAWGQFAATRRGHDRTVANWEALSEALSALPADGGSQAGPGGR